MTCCPGFEDHGNGVEAHDPECPTIPPAGWDDRSPWPPPGGSPTPTTTKESPMADLTLADVLGFIHTTASDDEVRRIFDAGNARVKALRAQATALAAATLAVGDPVVTHSLKPKYLSGCTGTVTKIERGDKFTVKLDNPPFQGRGRYYGDEGEIRVSAGCLRAA